MSYFDHEAAVQDGGKESTNYGKVSKFRKRGLNC